MYVSFAMHSTFSCTSLLLINMQVQTAKYQWLLTVELHQFKNQNNVIQWNRMFCCCGDWDYCSGRVEDLSHCLATCNTSFEISVPHCMYPPSCLLDTLPLYNTESVINLDYMFVFLLKHSPDMVSTNTNTREKRFLKPSFQLRMDLKKWQKQGRDDRTHEDYATSAKIHSRCSVVFLHSFISALFLSFFRPILNWNEVYKFFFPRFCSFRGFSKPLSK